MSNNNLEFEDWYSILNIEPDSTTTQIQNAYRKLARKYHPDKNKSQEAVIMFEKISIANITLCDENKRIIFDSQLFAKKEKKRKEQEMDSARKKMKQDLFERENQFKKRRENDLNSKRNVEMENEIFKQNYLNELRKQKQYTGEQQSSSLDNLLIKLKWKSKLGYNKDNIIDILSSYGIVDTFTSLDSASSSYTVAFATFTQIESIYQIIGRKDDLKKNYGIKVELKDSGSATVSSSTGNTTTTFSTNNNTTTTTTTTTSSSSSHHHSSGFTTTTSSTNHGGFSSTTTTSSSSSSFNNNNNNNNNYDYNIIDDEEDDILLQMKNKNK